MSTSPKQVFSAASFQKNYLGFLKTFSKEKLLHFIHIIIILRVKPGGSCYMKSKKKEAAK
jgi:hypothetical protein